MAVRHPDKSKKTPSDSVDVKQEKDYFDVLLLGRTGMGKSTTGNKLLNIEDDTSIKQWSSKTSQELLNSDGDKHFLQADELDDPISRLESVTKSCQLLSNESESYRALDIPGFADSKKSREFGGVYRANLEIMRQIVRVQMEQGLEFNRVLYFLPERGPPEKSHAVLQDEIRVMYRFFGIAIFHNMILVATWHPQILQRLPDLTFSPDEVEKTKEAFRIALKHALSDEDLSTGEDFPSPPVIFAGISETSESLRNKISQAYSKEPGPLSLQFRKDVCTKCAVRIGKAGKQEEQIKVVYDHEGNPHEYNKTKCHPLFRPKYAEIERIVGGVLYIVTLGIPLAVRRAANKEPLWPTFTSYDEICVECKKPPGSEGCTLVQTKQEVKLQSGQKIEITVDHSQNVERLVLDVA